MTTAGMSNNPMPSGISNIITLNPITTPMIVNNTLSSTTPTLIAANMNTKNTINPNNISILPLPFI